MIKLLSARLCQGSIADAISTLTKLLLKVLSDLAPSLNLNCNILTIFFKILENYAKFLYNRVESLNLYRGRGFYV